MILRILALSFLLCSLGYASETQNSPPPKFGSQHQSKATISEGRNSLNEHKTNAGTLIESSPSSAPKMDAPEKGEEKSGYLSAEWCVVWVTVALVLVTAALALYTARLYRATVELGREAKSTSENQAGALQAIERAYLFVEILLGDIQHPTEDGWKGSIKVKVWNYGKTPAEIVQIRAYPTLVPPQDLIDYPGSDLTIPPGLGIAQNSSFEGVSIPFHVQKDDWNNIQHMYTNMYCVGKIKYKDIFNLEHETGFCWFYRDDLAAYVIYPTSTLNYRT